MSDLIKREDAIEALTAEFCITGRENARTILNYLDLVKTRIEAIPSADRPQGEWVDAEIPLESGDTMPIQVCNLCKTFYPLAYTGGGHRFCPNCGAEMKGADDED